MSWLRFGLLVAALMVCLQAPAQRSGATDRAVKTGANANIAVTLDENFSLQRDLRNPEEHYFRSSTRYYRLNDADGKILGRSMISGDLRRRFVGYRADGCPLDEIAWKNVKLAPLPDDGSPAREGRKLAFAEGFTYRLCLEDKYSNIGNLVDHSNLPHTLEGFLFYEQIIDSHEPWDRALTHRYGHVEKLRRIGDEQALEMPGDVSEIDFRPFGYWRFNTAGRPPMQTKFTGLTRREGESAAILEFTGAELPTPFHSNIQQDGKDTERNLTTQWWSRAIVSLKDGSPLWGTLLERVDDLGHCQNAPNPGSGTYREVLLERISKREYDGLR